MLCPMKCVLASRSSSVLRSIVLYATTFFWTLWLIKLLYIYLEGLTLMLLSTRVSPLERVPKTMSVKFCWSGANALVWCIHLLWHGKNRLSSFALEALSHKIGVPPLVCLLSSCQIKNKLSLGVFDCLEKVTRTSVWLVF